MMSLDPVLFWYWWAFGGLLLIIEALVPGFVFLWLGVAAGVVGLLLLLWPSLELEYQVLVFALFSVASVVGWRLFQRARPARTDQPHLNRRGAGYVGQRSVLVAPIVQGHGRIKLADATWAVRGPDLPAGHQVRITGIDGVVLIVEPVDPPTPASGVPSEPRAAQSPADEPTASERMVRPAADPGLDRPTLGEPDPEARGAAT